MIGWLFIVFLSILDQSAQAKKKKKNEIESAASSASKGLSSYESEIHLAHFVRTARATFVLLILFRYTCIAQKNS